MDSNPASAFAVGYGNGYGYPAAVPAAMQATTTMPAIDTAALVAAPSVAAPVERDGDHRWVARGALAATLVVALLAGALLVGANRHGDAASIDLSSRRSVEGGTPAKGGPGLGGSIPDVTGSAGAPIVLDDASTTLPATTGAPTTAPPATAAPTTTAPAPTVPPSTTPPSTTPPVLTTPTIVVTPTIPPLLLHPTITNFTTPATGGCIAPFFLPQYIDISWSTHFATKVTLSIDGPGVYRTYLGASGSDSVPFACPGSHTYLLTAYNGSGDSVSQSVIING
jgi:hypothetical protein